MRPRARNNKRTMKMKIRSCHPKPRAGIFTRPDREVNSSCRELRTTVAATGAPDFEETLDRHRFREDPHSPGSEWD